MTEWMIHRRRALQVSACGFGHLAFSSLAASASPTSASPGLHFAPKAKRIIFLFMQGGPSSVDTFDYKPRLVRDNEKTVDVHDARKIANSGKVETTQRTLMGPLWNFRRHGQSQQWVSDLLPETAKHVDDLCFIKSLHGPAIAHGPATLFLHCGSPNLIRPSMGSWLSYGLGSANENLPAFVSICPSLGNGGPRNYGSAFLPPAHQGTPIGVAGEPYEKRGIPFLDNNRRTSSEQQQLYQTARKLSLLQAARGGNQVDQVMAAELQSLELAWRMQKLAPELLDVDSESEETKHLYGLDQKESETYGRQCLLARRLAESGVRYIQVTYGDNGANPAWDQHSNMQRHASHAAAVDRPVAGLLADLKRRGMLEDTIVWWGGEFGRTPFATGTGRDHNAAGFTHFIAGGGFRPGFSFGETDELGNQAVHNKVHLHDLHATLLHQLGIDHERLTYRHAGREFRLTDVHGRVVKEVLA